MIITGVHPGCNLLVYEIPIEITGRDGIEAQISVVYCIGNYDSIIFQYRIYQCE